MKGILPSAHMATNQIDYARVLNRSGVLNRRGRTALFAKQRAYSFDDIDEYLYWLGLVLNPNGVWRECLRLFDAIKETYEDEFRVISLSFDLIKNLRAIGNMGLSTDVSHVGYLWNEMLEQTSFRDNAYLSPHKSVEKRFKYATSPHQKYELWKTLTLNDAQFTSRASDYFVASLVREIKIIRSVPHYVPLPLAETERNMNLLFEWDKSHPGLLALRYPYISKYINMEYIAKNMHLPWNWAYVLDRHDLCVEVLKHPLIQGQYRNYSRILENTDIAHHQMPDLSPSVYSSVPDTFLQRGDWDFRNTSIWLVVRHFTTTNIRTQRFVQHAAAGVLQRVWRRHRERLRRRSFARDFLRDEDSQLTALPRELQWMVYRYVRPAHVLRGLPPKFH